MPSILPAAIIGGTGLVGSAISSNAATSAAQTQANAANNAAQIQENEFNQTEQNLSPFISSGGNLMSQYLALLGVNPGVSNADGSAYGGTGIGSNTLANIFGGNSGLGDGGAITLPQGLGGITGQPATGQPATTGGNNANVLAALQNTPGYQFQLQQGTQALADQATATGGVGGGNTLKALLGYGQGLASTTYQQQLADIANAAGVSENAAAGLGNTGASVASSIGNTLTSGAAATAAGQVGSANAISNGLTGAGSNFLLASLLGGANAMAGALSSFPWG